MSRQFFKGFVTCMVIAFVAVMALQAVAAVTTKNILPVMHDDLSGYTSGMVYIQVYNFEGTQVFDTTANSGAGGMVALASATYANTAIEVTVNSDFYVGTMPFPSGLSKGQYTVRLRGSTDATADKNDDSIGPPGCIDWTGRAIRRWYRGLPVSF